MATTEITAQDIINAQTNAKIEIVDTKLEGYMREMDARDKQRAEDMREIRQAFQNMQHSLMEMQTSNRHQNVLVIIGVAAMVIAVILK